MKGCILNTWLAWPAADLPLHIYGWGTCSSLEAEQWSLLDGHLAKCRHYTTIFHMGNIIGSFSSSFQGKTFAAPS